MLWLKYIINSRDFETNIFSYDPFQQTFQAKTSFLLLWHDSRFIFPKSCSPTNPWISTMMSEIPKEFFDMFYGEEFLNLEYLGNGHSQREIESTKLSIVIMNSQLQSNIIDFLKISDGKIRIFCKCDSTFYLTNFIRLQKFPLWQSGIYYRNRNKYYKEWIF